MSRRRHVLVFVLIYAFCLLNKINAQQQQQQQQHQLQQKQKEHLKRFNADASGIVESVNSHYSIYNNKNNNGIIENVNMLQQPIQLQQQQQQQKSDTWNPLSTHKNWFILRATTTASNTAKKQQQQQHQEQGKEKQLPQQQQQQERLPVNYYAYNHRFNQSSGNYKQVVTQTASPNNINNNNNKLYEDEVIDEQRVNSADVSQPYVLAISKTMRRGSMLSRQSHHVPAKPMPMPMPVPVPVGLPRVDTNILPKDIMRHNIDETFLSTHSVGADIISQQQKQQLRQKQQQQQQQHSLAQPMSQRQWQSVAQLPTPFVENNDISAATSVDGTATVKTSENNVVNDNENVASTTIADSKNNVAAAATTVVDDNDNDDDVDVDDVRLNELLLPLDIALDKVRFFCDIVKNLISDENDSDNENEHENTNAIDDGSFDDEHANNEATGDRDDDLTKIAAASKEIQGRDFALTATTSSALLSSALAPLLPTASLETTRALLSKSSSTTPLSTSYAGTGRKVKKLKKKLRKLLLPLLIAYKLKFLTLIPVLIGGLTLLVGTTGLAGFFFALFTAVMSLKSTGGSKSIIVKKI